MWPKQFPEQLIGFWRGLHGFWKIAEYELKEQFKKNYRYLPKSFG